MSFAEQEDKPFMHCDIAKDGKEKICKYMKQPVRCLTFQKIPDCHAHHICGEKADGAGEPYSNRGVDSLIRPKSNSGKLCLIAHFCNKFS